MTEPAQEGDGPSRATLARRVIGFDEALQNRVATTVTRTDFGVARLSRDLGRVYALNAMQIDRPIAPAELAPHVERVFEGLENQRLWTTHAEVAWSLGPSLAEDGWDLERVQFMVHDGHTAPPVSPVGFRAVDAAEFARFSEPYDREQPWAADDVIAQMQVRNERLQDRLDAKFVMSPDADAGCHVYRHGQVAQIESVGVLTEARGRGLGAGLLAAAIRASGRADTLFLIADVDDWPRRWYARWGFVPVASGWEWDRKPAS